MDAYVESTNWYSYTSNNPVRYIDPNGMTEVDHDEKIIYANLEDIDDLDMAALQLSELQKYGYIVVATNEEGYGFGFDSYSQILKFVEAIDPTSISWGDLATIASYASLVANVAGMVSLFVCPAATPGLLLASAAFDAIAAVAYAADGDYKSAIISGISATAAFALPSPGYNSAASRFTAAVGNKGRFIATGTARAIMASEAVVGFTAFTVDVTTEKSKR